MREEYNYIRPAPPPSKGGKGGKGSKGEKGQGKSIDDMTDEEIEKMFDGTGDPMDNNGQDCGSGAHGEEKDYEAGDPTPENPGISEAENDAIQREIAKNLTDQQTRRGNVPAGMRRWAEKILTPPKVRWQDLFKRLVRKAVGRAYGHDQRSWTRTGRMTAATGGKFLFPSTFSPKPRVGIVLDTSGSMGGGEANSPLHIACSETEGICKAVGVQVLFLAVDAAAGEVKEISSFKEACEAMQGGGGTDMRIGVEAMQKMKEPPHVVVILTDGDTPWPDHPVKDMTLIAGLVAGDRQVPEFIKKVLVEEDK